jgi:glycosyltransferase involved in cell wall biosynthesis/GT2 family glycosyltransferase
MPTGSLPEPPSPEFAPIRLDEIEIGTVLPALAPGDTSTGAPYAFSLCLVRLHGRPLGTIEVELPPGGVEPESLAEMIELELGEAIDRHLRRDGLDPVGPLDGSGIETSGRPPCLHELDAMIEDAPLVTVVIPTRNRPESALETLRSVLRSRYPVDRYEVIVVDNSSGAERRFRLPESEANCAVEVQVLQEEIPGSSNARNAGLHAAAGEVVAFTDDDVLVDPDWLASLTLPFANDDRVGGVAGLTLARQLETPAQSWYEGFSSANRGYKTRVLDRRNPPSDRPLFPFTVGDLGSGENFAFRRQLLAAVGGFDPDLGSATPTRGGEDIDAMLRVLLADWQVVYEPAAIVRHAHPRELNEFERRVWGYGLGLTACLTKALLEHPDLLPTLARKLPRGLAYALFPSSAKNATKPQDFPNRLTRLELRGMVNGPLAYARSRWRRRKASEATGIAIGRGSEPLRALIVTDSYWPLIGGANRSIELLAHNLAHRGHSVAIATAWQQGAPTSENQNGVQIHRLRDLTSRMQWISEDPYKHNPPPFPDPEAVLRLRRLISEFEPDIVHAYGWLTHSTTVALLGKRIPLLLSARSYGNICAVHTLSRYESICDGPSLAKCLPCASSTYGVSKGTAAVAGVLGSGPMLRRKTTAIHSVSRFVASKMDRFLRIEGARNVVIPNFHDDASDEPVDEEILARLPGVPFILYVGAFRRIKGIEDLFAAYDQLDDPPPLVMAGTRTPDTPSFPDYAIVIEDVPYPTVLTMWEHAMFGVFPTRIPEALGNVVHEAMSKGQPVIGTRPGGHEDMIEDGVNGILVPAGDVDALTAAMSRLVTNPGLRRRLGAAARERALDFTTEAIMPQMEQLYYQTVADFRAKSR